MIPKTQSFADSRKTGSQGYMVNKNQFFTSDTHLEEALGRNTENGSSSIFAYTLTNQGSK
jgi:hypothetical protein